MPNVKVLIVGGGGGHGGGVSNVCYEAGGGAGQVTYNTSFAITPGSYPVVIGQPGGYGGAGGNTTFSTLTAIGGSGGYTTGHGGASGSGKAGGGFGGAYGSGGGGGDSAVGTANSGNTPGVGGAGTYCDISGTNTEYGHGGNGNFGGGGVAGIANRGNGWNGTASSGSAGIVIIRYKTEDFGVCTGGTITTSGTDTIHTFTSNGTFVLVEKEIINYLKRYRRTRNLGSLTGLPFDTWQPKDIPNCALWIDATQHTTTADGQNATTIYDLSGNGNNLTQRNTGAVWVASGFLGKPVFRFDGARNYGFTEITGIRTVFWVIKEDADVATNQYKFLLGHLTLYEFHRGDGKTIWNSTHAPKMFNGTTKVNGVTCDGRSTNMPTTLSLVSVQTSDVATASQFNSDRDIAGRYWDGDMGEIIVYTRYLTQEEFLKVENYLRAKWGTG